MAGGSSRNARRKRRQKARKEAARKARKALGFHVERDFTEGRNDA